MNKELLENQWTQIREVLRTKFPNLTEDDIRQINGRFDQLVAKLQQKYGYTREEAEEKIKDWNIDRLKGTREEYTGNEKYFTDEYKKKKVEDNSTLYKWLLGIGIPLFLLGAIWYNYNEPTSKPMTSQQMMIETPADRMISDTLRTTLVSNPDLSAALRNVNITTRNGVVTLNGTVPNREVRNNIETTTRNVDGVNQVINNLQIR